ncbi:MAG: hypothetical protein KGK06_06885, partial [Xanthomonadaceae bacterium]|nr:hypothetical protein [Xanthomonadaceae bacterium]
PGGVAHADTADRLGTRRESLRKSRRCMASSFVMPAQRVQRATGVSSRVRTSNGSSLMVLA